MVAPLNKDLNESNYTPNLTRTMHCNLKNVCKLAGYLLYPLDFFTRQYVYLLLNIYTLHIKQYFIIPTFFI
jgi:DNA phosphorothioation-dependent restriction protein DptG